MSCDSNTTLHQDAWLVCNSINALKYSDAVMKNPNLFITMDHAQEVITRLIEESIKISIQDKVRDVKSAICEVSEGFDDVTMRIFKEQVGHIIDTMG